VKRLLIALLVALFLVAPAHAARVPPVDATSYLVLDAKTGDVLASRNPHKQVAIASLTKLMTVLLTLQHAKLGSVVTVAPSAASVGESSIDLHAGEKLTVHDLLEGALIQSANDAAYALAAYGGDGNVASFVQEMNAKARALHLRDTRYVRPDGLDAPGEHSSAADVTKLARLLMERQTVRQIVRKQTADIAGGRVLHTWNDLLGTFPGVIGVKTGHTDLAGWCQVALVRRNGVSVYVTILGSPSRTQRDADLAALLRWGLSRYRVESVISGGRTYALAQTGYGRAPLHLVAPARVRRTVRVDHSLTARVVAPAVVSMPVRAGQRLGTIRVFEGKRLIATRPLVAAHAVSRPGVAARVGFYARHTAQHIWSWVS
jgi:D-alanyl-D-alanine carboxypeptidase